MLTQGQLDWVGGYIDKYFSRIDTQVSLYWNGQVSMSIDSLRFLDEFTYRLDYDPNRESYWATCKNTFQQIQQDFRNDSRVLAGRGKKMRFDGQSKLRRITPESPSRNSGGSPGIVAVDLMGVT